MKMKNKNIFLKGSLGEPIRFYLYLIEGQTRIETEELTVHFCERFLHNNHDGGKEIMAYSRASVPELENLLKYGKKKFVRYDEGAKLYSMGLHSFQELAKEAGAVYHVKRIVLVNTEVIDAYMENFKD